MMIDLQRCGDCGAFQYPSRDLCRVCLSDSLAWEAVEARGHVVAEAIVHRSLEPERLSAGPLRIGAVAVDAGVRIIALLDAGTGAGMRVSLRYEVDGSRTLIAVPLLDVT